MTNNAELIEYTKKEIAKDKNALEELEKLYKKGLVSIETLSIAHFCIGKDIAKNMDFIES